MSGNETGGTSPNPSNAVDENTKIALVTGASAGIGAATAIALAAKGIHVVITGRNVKKLEEVEDVIHAAGGSATIAPLDMTEPEAIGRLSAAIASRWDRLDLLVISAAYLPILTPVTQIDGKQFSQALTVNVIATQALLAAFDPMLKRAGGAQVIGLTSSVGASPRAFWAAYGTTKAAFDSLLLSYAAEVEKIGGVRVAIVDPGATRTAMRAKAYPGEDPASVKPPEDVAKAIAELTEQDYTTGHRLRIG